MRESNNLPHNRRQAEVRNRALHALSQMRQKHLSLAEACRLEHIKPTTLRRYVGTALRQDRPGGRYRATRSDRLRRDLQLPTVLGPTGVPIRGSKNAALVSKYLNAVGAYLRKGDENQLRKFHGMKVGPHGRQIELITDPDTLSLLAQAGALQLEQLYASFTTAS